MPYQYTTHICAQCATPYPSNHPHSRYCNRACFAKARRVFPLRTCPVCSCVFAPSDAEHVYCKRECFFVARAATREARFWARVTRSTAPTDCWLIPNSPDHPYGRVGRGGAHQYAWELASGAPPPPDRNVCHTCDMPNCVRNDDAGTYEVGGVVLLRFGHLFLGTDADNMTDKMLKGHARGRHRLH